MTEVHMMRWGADLGEEITVEGITHQFEKTKDAEYASILRNNLDAGIGALDDTIKDTVQTAVDEYIQKYTIPEGSELYIIFQNISSLLSGNNGVDNAIDQTSDQTKGFSIAQQSGLPIDGEADPINREGADTAIQTQPEPESTIDSSLEDNNEYHHGDHVDALYSVIGRENQLNKAIYTMFFKSFPMMDETSFYDFMDAVKNDIRENTKIMSAMHAIKKGYSENSNIFSDTLLPHWNEVYVETLAIMIDSIDLISFDKQGLTDQLANWGLPKFANAFILTKKGQEKGKVRFTTIGKSQIKKYYTDNYGTFDTIQPYFSDHMIHTLGSILINPESVDDLSVFVNYTPNTNNQNSPNPTIPLIQGIHL